MALLNNILITILSMMCLFISYRFWAMHKKYTNGASEIRKSLSWLFLITGLCLLTYIPRMYYSTDDYIATFWTIWLIFMVGLVPFFKQLF